MISDSPLEAWGILPDEWKPLCTELGIPPYRAAQILNGLFSQFAHTWQDITTLPKELRDILLSRVLLKPLDVVTVQEAEDGVTKLLLGCADGERIESVLIPSKGRMTQCISTQVGCNFKCAFCASGQYGRVRNLTTAEIVGQVMAACDRMRKSESLELEAVNAPGKKIELPRPGNIVVMGMGEPFDNYDNMMRALKILNNQKGINIGARHITISTCGVVPGIQRLSDEGLQFELSVSLHAPTDELRNQLIPVNKRWPIAELIETCRVYFEKTNRIVTFEYTLIKNINDQPCHTDALIRLLRKLPCKINLIPLTRTFISLENLQIRTELRQSLTISLHIPFTKFGDLMGRLKLLIILTSFRRRPLRR